MVKHPGPPRKARSVTDFSKYLSFDGGGVELGMRSVLMSLRTVAEKPSAQLMKNLFRYMRHGQDKLEI
jgi:hypothetical protein